MKKYLRHLGPILISIIFVGAMYLLYNKLKAYSFEQIQESLSQISNWRLLASIGLMIVNYLILIGYDWLALVAIKKPLPLQRVSLVSFIGQTVSYNFGALLGGTTVRYRFYATWGFSLHDIVRLVLMLAVTFWVGALGLCGLVFIIAPPVIPAEFLEAFPVKDVRILGVLLLSVTLIYFVACHFVRTPIKVFGKEFAFPTLKIALLQAAVAGIDLIVAAACMYVLFSPDLGVSFGQFLPSYLMAQVAVVLTHVPGGVGVFELVILHLTHTSNEQMVIAVVLCFRLIYFILPLLMAALILAVYEIRHNRGILRSAGRWLSVLSHSINARITFVVGTLMLIFAELPIWQKGTFFLSLDWSTAMLDVLQMLCTLSGALLLFLAYGLEIRQKKAWWLTGFFLTLGLSAAIFRGLNLYIVLMFFMLFLSIISGRRRFYRKSFFFEDAFPMQWLWPAWLVLGLSLLIAYAFREGTFSWSWDNPLHTLQNMKVLLATYVILLAIWLWRSIQRRKTSKNSTITENR